ncbi:MAG: hypothetical protein ABI639_17180 [Thermoanaerobaculia bacterium]
MKSPAEAPESAVQHEGRNLLLVLGIFGAYCVMRWLLDTVVILSVQHVTFQGNTANILLWAIFTISPVLCSIASGAVAARFLHFSWAFWALAGVALFWAFWEYRITWASAHPEWWEPWLGGLRALLILILIPAAFLWFQKKLGKERGLESQPV